MGKREVIRYTEVPKTLGLSEELAERIIDIFESGQLTNNKWTKRFEDSFKEQFNLKGQCIAVNGCQNGLFLVLVALGVHRPLLPDFTFCSTAHAAYYACRDFKVGDCDPKTFNLDPRGRPECDCIIPTHLFGNPCNASEIGEIANELEVPVIYDAAHAIGASYKGKGIGDMGTASVFSLSPTKHITCLVRHTKIIVPKFRLRSSGHGWKWREQKDIERIAVGDLVLSYNEETGIKEYDEVTKTYASRPSEILKVVLSNGNDIEPTPNHPVYVINRGWIPAGELKVGDELLQYRYKWLVNRISSKKQLAGKSYEEQFGPEKADARRKRLSARMTYLHATPGTSHHDVDWENTLIKHRVSMKGKKMSPEACRLMSEKGRERYGRMSPNEWDALRKRCSDTVNRPDVKARISESMKRKWQDPEYRKMNLARSRQAQANPEYWRAYAKGLNLRPNRTEMKLGKIINRMCPGEYQYNGDYKLGVTLDRLIPDFVNVNGKKKVIDFLGTHWHKPEEEGQRLERFRKCGFDGLIIWERELRDVLALQQRIKTFNYNPNVEIVKIVEVKRKSFHQIVYNIETQKNHNYFANGILVHNCGEGGMIVTSNQCLADKLRKLRNYGNEPDYDCKLEGLNARTSEFHAIIGLESLHHFKDNFSKRMCLVEEYRSELPPEMLQQPNPEGTHAWKDLSILVGQKREKVQRALTEHEIEYRTYFRPISALSCYEGWQVPQPNSKRLFQSILQLPLHCGLETEDVRRICKVVSSIVGMTEGIAPTYEAQPEPVSEKPVTVTLSPFKGG
jgi:dTDP-4-amino-4,6-dideoxygalactose transaminase